MMSTKIKTLLWLDDIRDPNHGDWLIFSPITNPFKVVWIKTYGDFIGWITKNGLPDGICFDHDLGDNFSLRADSDFGDWFDMDNNKEFTGYDASKWLVDYCMDNDKNLPLWNIHSANPVGADNIRKYLTNAKKHLKI